MEFVGAVSGATLGYISGGTRGAIKGWKVGRRLSQTEENMVMAKRQRTSGGYKQTYTGNTKYRTSGRSSNYVTKRGRRRGTSFNKMLMLNTPAKHETYSPTQALLHNNIYGTNITEQIVQGFGNEGRDGDSIYLEAVKFRGILTSSTTAGAYSYRILIGFTGEEITTGGAFNLTISTGHVFLPNGASQLTSIVNPKAFTVLYDQVFDINSQIAATADVNSFAATVPIKQKFMYQSSASIYGKTKNLFMLVIGNVFGGISGTTATGEIVVCIDTIFK